MAVTEVDTPLPPAGDGRLFEPGRLRLTAGPSDLPGLTRSQRRAIFRQACYEAGIDPDTHRPLEVVGCPCGFDGTAG